MSQIASSRYRFIVTGQVQGVGFRPFVYRIAHRENLTGTVGNTADGVRIEVQGSPDAVSRFAAALRHELPPLARVSGCLETECPPHPEEQEFCIVPSEQGNHSGHRVLVSPDTGICADCLADMRDPENPRYRYPFTNCTNCGPRYTITRAIPYDRATTSMACFPLCPQCAEEYANPLDRRFHAQPNACPVCGPRVWLVEPGTDAELPVSAGEVEEIYSPDRQRAAVRSAAESGGGAETAGCGSSGSGNGAATRPSAGGTVVSGAGGAEETQAALKRAAELLRAGRIVAIKGLGGFLLACDAYNTEAVQLLRKRKHRPHKPFAVMVSSLAAVRQIARPTPGEEALLSSPEKPIVLCRKIPGPGAALPDCPAPAAGSALPDCELFSREAAQSGGLLPETGPSARCGKISAPGADFSVPGCKIHVPTSRPAQEADSALSGSKIPAPEAALPDCPVSDVALPDCIAPDVKQVGLMLPYTPLHVVLFDLYEELAGKGLSAAEEPPSGAAGGAGGSSGVSETVACRNSPDSAPASSGIFSPALQTAAARPAALVMTSGNVSGEPICLGNREALQRLSGLADAFLLHNRDILVRSDDSVLKVQGESPAVPPLPETSSGNVHPVEPGQAGAERGESDIAAPRARQFSGGQEPGTGGKHTDRGSDNSQTAGPLFFRRARGYVPRPVSLPERKGAPCVLGCGAELKATVCLTRGNEAFVGQHLGDLENLETFTFYEECTRHLESLLEVKPDLLVHDMHPDFMSTRYARERAAREGLPCIALQHHAAHAAGVLAENDQYGDALVLALDGTGLGTDGTIWGGELIFMNISRLEWRREGHLSPFPLAGGEAAIREPWRIAEGLLHCPLTGRSARELRQNAEYLRPGGTAEYRPSLQKESAMEAGCSRSGSSAGIAGTRPECGNAANLQSAMRESLTASGMTCAASLPGLADSLPWRGEAALPFVRQMLQKRLNTLLTSSCGRLFDAVSALLGLCLSVTYEGQAAIRLEAAVPPDTDWLKVRPYECVLRAGAAHGGSLSGLHTEENGGYSPPGTYTGKNGGHFLPGPQTEGNAAGTRTGGNGDYSLPGLSAKETGGSGRNPEHPVFSRPLSVDMSTGIFPCLELDSFALFAEIVADRQSGRPVGEIAAAFHLGLARGFAAMAARRAAELHIRHIGLSGGVLQNAVLAELLPATLRQYGLIPLTHHELPAGDGGLSLGQAVWGRQWLAARGRD